MEPDETPTLRPDELAQDDEEEGVTLRANDLENIRAVAALPTPDVYDALDSPTLLKRKTTPSLRVVKGAPLPDDADPTEKEVPRRLKLPMPSDDGGAPPPGPQAIRIAFPEQHQLSAPVPRKTNADATSVGASFVPSLLVPFRGRGVVWLFFLALIGSLGLAAAGAGGALLKTGATALLGVYLVAALYPGADNDRRAPYLPNFDGWPAEVALPAIGCVIFSTVLFAFLPTYLTGAAGVTAARVIRGVILLMIWLPLPMALAIGALTGRVLPTFNPVEVARATLRGGLTYVLIALIPFGLAFGVVAIGVSMDFAWRDMAVLATDGWAEFSASNGWRTAFDALVGCLLVFLGFACGLCSTGFLLGRLLVVRPWIHDPGSW